MSSFASLLSVSRPLCSLFPCFILLLVSFTQTGCWLGVGAAAGEAGYVAAQDKRTTGETIDDQLIHTTIKSKLLGDSVVHGLDINVDVNKGMVTLRGYVKSEREIDRALEIVRGTRGVRDVDSRLILDR